MLRPAQPSVSMLQKPRHTGSMEPNSDRVVSRRVADTADDDRVLTDMLHCLLDGDGFSDAAADQPACVNPEHWQIMFHAVKDRLALTVDAELAEPQAAAIPKVRNCVLECVEALGQLEAMLEQERSRQPHPRRRGIDSPPAMRAAPLELFAPAAATRRGRSWTLHDRFTSHPSRASFRERLERALAQVQPLRKEIALLHLDLDGLKPINDAHGREAGDELLRIVASRLVRAVRAEDIVSRLGADEFACVLAGVPTREQLGQRAWRIFDAVSAPFRIGDLNLSLLPSIGIAICPTDGTTADALIKSVGAARLCAKGRQSGYAFVDADAQERDGAR